MLSDKKSKIRINNYSDQIKEVSIRRNFPKEKPISTEESNFLYCDPPEVILQSK
jgi:site-specific DNA-adenine methylase